MDSLLYDFITQNYNPHLLAWFLEGYQILAEYYEHSYGDEFVAAMAYEDDDVATLQDRINSIMNRKLLEILEQHGVHVFPEATPEAILALCATLLRIQHLEDYEPVALVMESLQDDVTKFCEVVKLSSSMTDVELEDAIEFINPTLLERIRRLAEKHVMYQEEPQVPPANQIDLLKRARTVLAESIGMQMVEAGVLIGRPFEKYLPFVKNHFANDDPAIIARSILSVILLSSDGYKAPHLFFREVSEELLDSPVLRTQVDGAVAKLMNEIEQVKLT